MADPHEEPVVITHLPAIAAAAHAWRVGLARRFGADERGEGVISMGVAVLITVVIGALMFAGLRLFWEDMYNQITDWLGDISG
jgi:Family of unknown function (DUF6133)